MPTRTLLVALPFVSLALLGGSTGCKNAAEKLEEKLKSEMPADCRPYCGIASCGGECTSAESVEKAKLVIKAHCPAIKDIGTQARVQKTGDASTNQYLDSSTCEFKNTP